MIHDHQEALPSEPSLHHTTSRPYPGEPPRRQRSGRVSLWWPPLCIQPAHLFEIQLKCILDHKHHRRTAGPWLGPKRRCEGEVLTADEGENRDKVSHHSHPREPCISIAIKLMDICLVFKWTAESRRMWTVDLYESWRQKKIAQITSNAYFSIFLKGWEKT